MKKIISTIFILLLVLVSGMLVFTSSASAATNIVLSKVVVEVVEGQNFTIGIALDPGDIKNYTAKIEAAYPSDLLEMNIFTFGEGWIQLNQPGYDLADAARGLLIKTGGYPTGFASTQTFGTISFSAKKAGSGVISVGGNSLVLDATNQNVLGGVPVQVRLTITKKPLEEEPVKEELLPSFEIPEEIPGDYFLDSDNDGIPDGWETVNGLDPNNFADACQDRDRDGLVNLEEYVFGMNPADNDTYATGITDGIKVTAMDIGDIDELLTSVDLELTLPSRMAFLFEERRHSITALSHVGDNLIVLVLPSCVQYELAPSVDTDLDLNQDEKADITLSLKSVVGDKAILAFGKSVPALFDILTEPRAAEPQEKKPMILIAVLVSILLIAGVGYVIFLKIKKRKKRKDIKKQ